MIKQRLTWTLWAISPLLAGVVILVAASPLPSDPAIYPDEICFLGWQRAMTGGDFYSMGSAAYCHPLYPSISALAGSFVPSVFDNYQAAIALNYLIAGACFPLAWLIAQRHFGTSALHACCGALVTVMYPPLLAYSAYVWPESLLYLLSLAILWSWCRWLESPRGLNTVLLTSVVVLAYASHPRMIGLVGLLVAAMMARWYIRRDSESRRTAVFVALACTLSLGAMVLLKDLILPLAWAQDSLTPLDRLYGSASENSASAAGKLAGQLLFAFVISAGAVILPLAWIMRHRRALLQGEIVALKIAAAPAMFLVTALIAAVFLSRSERFDTFFYGRYAGPLILINILTGLSLLKHRQNLRVYIVSISALSLGLSLLFSTADSASDYSRIHVVGLQPLFDWLQPRAGSLPYYLGLSLAASAATLTAFLLGRRKWPWYGSALLALYLGAHITGEPERTARSGEKGPAERLSDLMADSSCRIAWSDEISGRVENHQAYRTQWLFPHCDFSFTASSEHATLDPGTLLVAPADDRSCSPEGTLCLHLEPNLSVSILAPPE